MKILITTGIYPPDIGGPASYVPEIAYALHKRGHGVSVVTLSDVQRFKNDVNSFIVHRIKRSLLKPLRWICTVSKMSILAKRHDVIYANGLNFESCLSGLITGKPVVYKVVGDYAWERARNRKMFSGSIEAYQRAKKNAFLILFDLIRTIPLMMGCSVITPSLYLKRIVNGWGIGYKKIRVIYNAVRLNGDNKKKGVTLPVYSGHTVVTICRLVPWKNVDRLIHIIKNLKDCRLIIVGDGPLRASLENQVCESGLQKRILFTGNVEKSDIKQIFSNADLFALISTYEGLPHVVLEAMSNGVPVVATDVGGTGEVVVDKLNGRLVPANNSTEAALAIQEILGDKSYAEQLCIRAFEMIRTKFAFNTMVDQTERVLEKASVQ